MGICRAFDGRVPGFEICGNVSVKLTKIIVDGLCASGEYMDHPDSIYCKDNPNNKRMLEIFEEMRLPGTTREQRIELAKEWIMMSL